MHAPCQVRSRATAIDGAPEAISVLIRAAPDAPTFAHCDRPHLLESSLDNDCALPDNIEESVAEGKKHFRSPSSFPSLVSFINEQCIVVACRSSTLARYLDNAVAWIMNDSHDIELLVFDISAQDVTFTLRTRETDTRTSFNHHSTRHRRRWLSSKGDSCPASF